MLGQGLDTEFSTRCRILDRENGIGYSLKAKQDLVFWVVLGRHDWHSFTLSPIGVFWSNTKI